MNLTPKRTIGGTSHVLSALKTAEAPPLLSLLGVRTNRTLLDSQLLYPLAV